ncbi:S24 family peptidase [Acetobacter sp. P5B1]|uniref:XRE family transcriptional regulator n=1 Tax=Acetobacter sp. P5B1 TaxID=2762620 RepID=UPI001C041152
MTAIPEKSNEKNKTMQHLSERGQNRQTEELVLRIREVVERSGTQKQVAARAGIPASTLSEYLKGREVKLSLAARIAEACGVSLEWLATGKDTPVTSLAQTQTESAEIDYYDEEASAGFGRCASDAPQPQQVSISRQFLHELCLTPNYTIMLKVAGDSMEPTLKAGDRLILNTSPSHFLSGVTVFVSSGQLMVKRLSPRASGTVMIISDNDRYPPQEAEISRFRWGKPDGNDSITVIGRVAYRLQAMS